LRQATRQRDVDSVGAHTVEHPCIKEHYQRSISTRSNRLGDDSEELAIPAKAGDVLPHFPDNRLTSVHLTRCCHPSDDCRLFPLGVKVHYFGASPNLFGVLHLPQRLRARSASVLLCNPFGEEAARAHRIYRVMATQLERAGYACLRFDYSHTGDSAGDSRGASVEQWLRDLAVAASQLRSASGTQRVALVGLRFGATLAALATSRGELRPRHVLLWDPVVNGATYLRELAAQHRQYLREEMAEVGWEDRLTISAQGFPTEALGTLISARLADELAGIDLTNEAIHADLTTVISTQTSAELDRWAKQLGGGAATRWVTMAESAAWNSDAALNAATVPMDIVQTLISRIEETIP
jgi:uncharacterized protein